MCAIGDARHGHDYGYGIVKCSGLSKLAFETGPEPAPQRPHAPRQAAAARPGSWCSRSVAMPGASQGPPTRSLTQRGSRPASEFSNSAARQSSGRCVALFLGSIERSCGPVELVLDGADAPVIFNASPCWRLPGREAVVHSESRARRGGCHPPLLLCGDSVTGAGPGCRGW